MKITQKIAALAFVMVGFAATANAQNTAESTSSATATVIAPIAITNDGGLSFGAVIATAEGGTITVSTGDDRTATVDALLAPSDNYAAASFTITGEAGRNFGIELPTEETLQFGEEVMTVSNFISSLGIANIALADGSIALKVGADLELIGNQPAGEYTGEFAVTVTYE